MSSRHRRPRKSIASGPRGGRKTTAGAKGDGAAPIADVFKELLDDVEEEEEGAHEAARPLKRRRVGDSRALPLPEQSENEEISRARPDTRRPKQTITQTSESEGSDLEWENVELDGDDHGATSSEEPLIEGVSVVMGGDVANVKGASRSARPAVTAAVRRMRLDIHKIHICCLLHHNYLRNAYCNDVRAHRFLSKIVSQSLKAKLVPPATATQSRRSYLFVEGLKLSLELWKARFTITRTGLGWPQWRTNLDDLKLDDNVELAIDRGEFRDAAYQLHGSADLSAQLFCSLLRSVGVTARLVCSLQTLHFSSTMPISDVAHKASAKASPKKVVVHAEDLIVQNGKHENATSVQLPSDLQAGNGEAHMRGPARISRLGRSDGTNGVKADMGKALPSTAIAVPRPTYPLYWVEAFNHAQQKWVAIDPAATLTVDKPGRLEPPLSFRPNPMSYVIAFEEDGSAKDVTRRYAKAYSAKTRKTRVEITEGGQQWLRRAMRLYRRREPLDRDEIESQELAKREAKEGMPRNVQDFKNHPYYVLERHLRRNEVIHPKREAGKISSGPAAKAKLEPVYRRQDVHVVRSSEKWYRMGREVKMGEEALKMAKPKMKKWRDSSPDGTDYGDEVMEETPLFAAFQTELYVAPPVVRGRIPKNGFGNLDVYVPSMVPPGGIHSRSPDVSRAAKLLGIDYADAVTGFKFQGRQGTAVVDGAVVAQEYEDAIEAVLEGFRDERYRAMLSRRSTEALRLWRRFLIGLRVAERVDQYLELDGSAEADAENDASVQRKIDIAEAEMDVDGGGFMADESSGGYLSAVARAETDQAHPETESLLPLSGGLFGVEGLRPMPPRPPKRWMLPLNDDVGDDIAIDVAEIPEFSDMSAAPSVASVFEAISSGEQDHVMIEQSRQNGCALVDSDAGDSQYDHAMKNKHDGRSGQIMRHSASQDIMTTHHSAPRDECDGKAVEGSGRTIPPDATKAGPEHTAEPQGNEASSEDERGSLLSHDPEDEDAEPEWLLDAMD